MSENKEDSKLSFSNISYKLCGESNTNKDSNQISPCINHQQPNISDLIDKITNCLPIISNTVNTNLEEKVPLTNNKNIENAENDKVSL